MLLHIICAVTALLERHTAAETLAESFPLCSLAPVSYRGLHTLDDVLRAGLHLEVTCQRCGRRGVFANGGFFGVESGGTCLDRLAARMRCQGAAGSDNGCGHRGADIQAIAWPPIRPAVLPPKPVASLAPRGVHQAEWDKADDRGRKRLVQRARG